MPISVVSMFSSPCVIYDGVVLEERAVEDGALADFELQIGSPVFDLERVKDAVGAADDQQARAVDVATIGVE